MTQNKKTINKKLITRKVAQQPSKKAPTSRIKGQNHTPNKNIKKTRTHTPNKNIKKDHAMPTKRAPKKNTPNKNIKKTQTHTPNKNIKKSQTGVSEATKTGVSEATKTLINKLEEKNKLLTQNLNSLRKSSDEKNKGLAHQINAQRKINKEEIKNIIKNELACVATKAPVVKQLEKEAIKTLVKDEVKDVKQKYLDGERARIKSYNALLADYVTVTKTTKETLKKDLDRALADINIKVAAAAADINSKIAAQVLPPKQPIKIIKKLASHPVAPAKIKRRSKSPTDYKKYKENIFKRDALRSEYLQTCILDQFKLAELLPLEAYQNFNAMQHLGTKNYNIIFKFWENILKHKRDPDLINIYTKAICFMYQTDIKGLKERTKEISRLIENNNKKITKDLQSPMIIKTNNVVPPTSDQAKNTHDINND